MHDSFSQGVSFILNKMIRKDPEMRYSANDLMNDSWVISGPLITAKSYFSNSNIKAILNRSLVSRNKADEEKRRPSTGSYNLFKRNKSNALVVSSDKIPTYTHYKGFGTIKVKNSNDSEIADDQSVSVRLKQQLSNQPQVKTNYHMYENNYVQDNKPGSSYFKPALKKHGISSRGGRQISFKDQITEDSY